MSVDLHPLKKKKLWQPGPTDVMKLERAQIEALVPYRDPALLLDEISHLNTTRTAIVGQRNIHRDDPVFRGHLVGGEPVYPGGLLLEIFAQCGLCLIRLWFQSFGPQREASVQLRVFKLHEAVFLRKVPPGAMLSVICQLDEIGEFAVTCLGQILDGDEITTIALMEVYYFFDER